MPAAPRRMMDLGANRGQTSKAYLEKGWKVVAVEPHPDLAEALYSEAPVGLAVVKAAITPEGHPTRLFVSSKGTRGETHSIHPHRVKQCEAEGITVPGVTVAWLFLDHGVPEYLKIDIEGVDVVALHQLHVWQAKAIGAIRGKREDFTLAPVPKFVSVELDWEHPEEALEMFAHFGYMGYDKFALVRQTHGHVTDVDEVVHCFPLSEAASVWFGRAMPPPKDTWYDLHATRGTP